MSKLERWLTLVANLSVVAGIMFLAVEISQNTDAIRAEIYQTRAFENAAISSATAESEHIVRINTLIRSADGTVDLGAIDSLSAMDRQRLAAMVNSQIRTNDNNLFQCELDYLEEVFCTAWRDRVARDIPFWKKALGGTIDPAFFRITALDPSND